MTDNQVIHEAMGGEWHDEEFFCECGDPWCYKIKQNPDYTKPEHYCRLIDWMRENILHPAFGLWLKSTHDISMSYHWLALSRQEQVSLIAEAIREGVLK